MVRKGRVKWFDEEKGFGYIETETDDEDVFVHYADIQVPGFKTLKKGTLVSFVVGQSEYGLKAEQVVPISSD